MSLPCYGDRRHRNAGFGTNAKRRDACLPLAIEGRMDLARTWQIRAASGLLSGEPPKPLLLLPTNSESDYHPGSGFVRGNPASV
jgi:hypothetical protein